MFLVDSATTDCTNVRGVSMESPFDGLSRPLQLSQLTSRWGPIKFRRAGNFTFCYEYNGARSYMPIHVHVYGTRSSDRKVFCRLDTTVACDGLIDILGNVTGKVALVPHVGGSCGTSAILNAFEILTPPLIPVSTALRSFTFGKPFSSTASQSYRICLCPDFEAQSNGSTSCSSSSLNFVQEAGLMVLTGIGIRDPYTGSPSAIAPRIKFNLEIICGSGGCSTSSSRVKLVDSSENNKLRGACSTSLQSAIFIGPTNCLGNATACTLEALPDQSGNGSKIVFPNLQLDSRLVDNVRGPTEFDVCFCNSDCWLRSNWFFVDNVEVQAINVGFSIGGKLQSRPTIKTSGSVYISVNKSVAFRLTGSTSREMKMIQDNARSAGSSECLSTIQSKSLITGHDCYSATNCESPSFNSTNNLIFGIDDISVLQAGWISVCFCNTECMFSSNWFVIGRLLFSGPSLTHSWSAATNLEFTLRVLGWGLGATDRLSACPPSGVSVSGPLTTTPQLLGGIAISNVTDAADWDVRLEGTVIQFVSNHGLISGDRITIGNDEAVTVLSSSAIMISRPFNSSFRPSSWWRSNQETFGTFFAESAGNYSICWSPSITSSPIPIGIVRVYNPPTASGLIGLGTIVPGTPSPTVLQFPSSLRVGAFLRIVFPPLLEPVDAEGNSFPTLSQSLAVCGLLFMEMNSAGGFSYPTNCSFAISSRGRKEITVRFSDDNGLRVSDSHSFVLMTKSSPGLSPVNGFVEVWMMLNDGTAVEVINLRATRTVSALIRPSAPPQVSLQLINDLGEPVIKLTGYCVSSCNPCTVDSDCPGSTCVSPATYACSKFFSFRIRLSGDILYGSQLRILLLPINDWNVQQSVVITSQSSAIVTATTENIVSGPLVGDAGGNIISFTLPWSNTSSWFLSVGSLRLPRNGFFPTSIWAEIIPPDLTLNDPVFLQSSMEIYARPIIKFASLVKPSKVSRKGDTNVAVHIRVVLGLVAPPGTAITVQMPDGYQCKMPMVAGCDVSNDPQGCGFNGITGNDLDVFKGTTPSGRGLIGERTAVKEYSEAGWTKETSACVLTLKTNTRIFSQSSIYLSFLVDNPSHALQRDYPSNVWKVKLWQDGIDSIPRIVASDGSAFFVNNFAVVGILRNITVAPSSLNAGADIEMEVSFTTENNCGSSEGTSIVRLQADIDFSGSCELTTSGSDFEPITVGSSCIGDTVNGLVELHTNIPLKSQTVYNLRLGTRNRFSGKFQLQLWTESTSGSQCDISPTIDGWSVYPHVLKEITVTISDLRPGNSKSLVTIFPISLPDTSAGPITITAPRGYVWNFASFSEFFYTPEAIPGAEKELPLSTLPTSNSNVLVIDHLVTSLAPGVQYGIATYISVPLNNPGRSNNVFVVEVGSIAAAVIPVPRVKRIVDARIVFKTTIAEEPDNTICMQFETISPISRGGRIIVEFQASGFSLGPAGCFLRPWGEYDSVTAFPRDHVCSFKSDPGFLNIISGPSGLPAKQYRFCIDFRNPSLGEVRDWHIYSQDITGKFFIDSPAILSGFQLKQLIAGGRLPLPNTLGFWFQVNLSDQAKHTEIVVVAPQGFKIKSDCTVNVSLGLPSYAPWPQDVLTVICTETGVILSAPVGLDRGSKYAFQISSGVIAPSKIPYWNIWTIYVNNQFSTRGIPGSALAIFNTIKIIPTDISAGKTNVTVRLTAIPQTTIPALGRLTITLSLESGFTFPVPCSVWTSGNSKLLCSSSRVIPTILNITISSGAMLSFVNQEIFLTVNNPGKIRNITDWNVVSYDGNNKQLDQGRAKGYEVVPRITRWTLDSASSAAGGDFSNIELSLGLGVPVEEGDIVEIKAPEGFVLNRPGSSQCLGSSTLGTSPSCVGNVVRFSPIVMSGKILLTTYNPSSTPSENSFAVKHLRAKQRIGFGILAGIRIIPKLLDCGITFIKNAGTSAGSSTSVTIDCLSPERFDRLRITGHSFNMSLATASGEVTARSGETVEVTLNSTTGRFRVALFSLKNPAQAGKPLWNITALTGSTVVAQSPRISGPTVLGRLEILRDSSSLTPREYGSKGSELAFSFVSSLTPRPGDFFVLTPPPGYELLNSSKLLVEAGDGYSPIRLRVNLPITMNRSQARNWRIDLRSKTEDKLIATNDGDFEGFWLLSTLSFSVVPLTTGPNLRTDLQIRYRIPIDITMASKSVAAQIIAPEGFVFSSSISCLSVKSDLWISCAGSGNIATVQASRLVIPAGPGMLEVIVFNPLSTPINNTWTFNIYVDDDLALLTSVGTSKGYPVNAMETRFIGTSRMGSRSVGFFVFRLSSVPSTFFQVLIQPPRGYTLLCDQTYHVGMKSAPLCSGNADQLQDISVGIIIPKSEIGSSKLFTIAVTVLTATSRVQDDLNFFSLIVQDSHGTTIDANTHVPAPNLAQVYVQGVTMTSSNRVAMELSQIYFEFIVEVPINSNAGNASSWLTLRIDAPDNFVLGNHVSLPSKFKVKEPGGVKVKGNRVVVSFKPGYTFEIGKYSISFTVMNPTLVPYNNYWIFYILQGETTYFVSPVEGYLFN